MFILEYVFVRFLLRGRINKNIKEIIIVNTWLNTKGEENAIKHSKQI